jgi:uncharacterized membrane protein
MLPSFHFSSQLYGSLALLGLATGGQLLLSRAVRSRVHGEDARRILIPARNAWTAVTLIGLGLLWAQEMQAMLLSIVAVLAALILVSRDVLVSVMAALARSASSPIELGSLVRVRGHRGIVVDRGALFMALAEVQPEGAPQYTGRIVNIPNSWMMTEAVAVEDYTGRYTVHTVALPARPADARALADRLLALAQAEYAVYGASAEAALARFERKTLLDAPSGAPRITFIPQKPEEMLVSLRMAMPKPDKYDIEQRLLRALLNSTLAWNSSEPCPRLPAWHRSRARPQRVSAN